jgi:uncharacterized protein DUF3562
MATSMKSLRHDGGAGREQSIAESLAQETDTSVDLVREIYEQERSSLASEAKITQYLDVLTSRRVKLLLRKH